MGEQMGLISQLKSLLGMGAEQKQADGNDVEVTVERQPDADSEQAVKAPANEVDTEADDSGVDDEEAEAYEEEIESEGAAAGTDAAASTETLVEEDNADEPEEAAEPAEAAGPTDGSDDLEPEPTDEGGDESETDENDEGVAEGTDAAASTETLVDEGSEEAAEPAEAAGSAPGDDEPVERLKGIGPAYAETLGEAGVASIADLAAVEDVEALAEETELSAKRLGRWVDRAQSWEP